MRRFEFKRSIQCVILTFCLFLLTGITQAAPATFVHPGLLHTEADFTRMRTKVALGASPWIDGWNVLIANPRSGLGWNPRPTSTVIRGGTGQNYGQFYPDVHAAYQSALRWKVSGDNAYADKSISIMNAWSAVLTSIGGNADRFLAAGIYGYEFANAAEIMRTYPGWAPADFARFQNMMLTVFYPMNHDFLVNHNTAAITNYWANWDLCNMASVLAIGVLCDRGDLYDEAITYFKSGAGNGAMDRAVYYVHPGNLGQWQESGRDQGHTTLGIALMGPICEMAWNQGEDLYGYGNNRFLAGAEYVAKYNLFEEVPFQTYNWGTGQTGTWQTQTVVSGAARGNIRPAWEMVYNHYVNRKGIATPYSAQFAAQVRPEGGGGNYGTDSGGFDQLGFGTLTFTRDPIATPVKPSALFAAKSAGNVVLSWWGAPNATGYNVKRATHAGGPYTSIGTTAGNVLTYTDSGLSTGKYFYVVTGTIANGETAPSNEVSISTIPELQTWLPANETGGTVASDATGSGHDATLNNGATWATGENGNAISLDGTNDYVSLPVGTTATLADFTISCWVNLNAVQTWNRILDFGDDTGRYMYLTPRNGAGKVSFATSTVYGYNGQVVEGTTALPANQWVHVAVTLEGRVGTLYVNGAVVGTNPNMDFPPFQLGATRNNWLGRSQFPDPYLNGKIDDFRIYNGALSSTQMTQLYNATLPSVPTGLVATPASTRINLSWDDSNAATNYTVKRSTRSGGPYTKLSSNVFSSEYIDTSVVYGLTYYYVVSASNPTGESGNSTQKDATLAHLYLKLDETTGTNAADSSGNLRNGTLINSSSWVAGKINNGVSLSGSNQYLSLPSGVLTGLNNFTIAGWVKPNTSSTWSRVFDFGSGTGANMFLTPRSSDGKVRYAITIAGISGEQRIDGTNELPIGVWSHVAVTRSGNVGTLYINGTAVGSNTNMTLAPSNLGSTTQNWLGRSQYPDPYLNGTIDDFRVVNRAITAGEIAVLANQSP